MRVVEAPASRVVKCPPASEHMKQLAADLTSGEITGYAVVLQFADGRPKKATHASARGYALLGALDACKFDLNLSLSEM